MINRPLGAHAPGGRSFYTPLALTVTQKEQVANPFGMTTCSFFSSRYFATGPISYAVSFDGYQIFTENSMQKQKAPGQMTGCFKTIFCLRERS